MRSLGLFVALLALFSVSTQAQVTYASAWTQQEPTAAPADVPSPRYEAAVAGDNAGHVVLFGGYGTNGALADTWVWNGSTWTQQSPANSPPARYNAGAAYDAAHGVVVLFGGSDQNGGNQNGGVGLNDTWTWDGANWTQQDANAAAAALPSPRARPGMAYDAAGHIVLFGGFADGSLIEQADTWIWNGSSWSQPTLVGNTPAGRDSPGMAYDAASGQTVLFGGYNGFSFPLRLGDTWTWNGSAWTQQSPASAPASRSYASMAYDADAGEVVLFGGVNNGYTEINDTWTWNGSAWTEQFPPASPASRFDSGMAYASSAHQMVLFGGEASDYASDTWTYQVGPYNFGNVNVCATGQTTPAPCNPQTTLTFNIGSTITIGSVKVVTQGAANLDFTYVRDTCVGPQTAPATCTVTVQFAPLAPGVRTGAVEIFDSSNNLLVTEPLSGIGQAPAVVFPSAATQTVIADLSPNQPRNLTVDAAGNVFVAECCQNGPDQVLEIKGDGSGTTTITTPLPDGGGGLFGVAEDGAGALYVASPNTHYIYQIPAGCQSSSCYVQAGFAAEANQIALDAVGDLFAVDGLGRVYKYPPTCFGSSNLANCGTILGSGFKYPEGVAVDAAGNVYVADNGNGAARVVKIPADGSAQTDVGVGLNSPVSVAVDAAGDVFIADTTLAYIVEVPAGCTSADCQLQIGSGFSLPIGVAVDSVGNVYVSDQVTGKVTKITLATPPALTFPATNVGSSSSAQSFLLQNIGNQPLTGTLAVGTGFAQVSGAGTPADCAASLSLAPGAECNASIDFTPTVGQLYSSAAVFTDNALNATPSAAVQSVALSGTGNATTVNVTIGTSPAGLSFSISGITYTTTQTPTLPIGTPVALGAPSPQYAGGVEYSFVSWSDGSNVLMPSAATTSDTANFSATDYQLTVTAGAGGTIAAATAANGYYPANSQQPLVATPNAGYYFTGWTGSSDIASASSASTIVTMTAPESIAAGFAQIPSYTVTNLNDDASAGSLRAAITSADANTGGAGTITFAPSLASSSSPATITLLSPLPALNGAITISGPGANALTVSGNSSTTVGSIFTVSGGATATISGLTLANGSVASNSKGFDGGAILNSGTLTVANCILQGNSDANGTGGAIYNNGKLTVANSILSNNTARGYKEGGIGGAIDSVFGTVSVTDSTFSGNQTGTFGGAIAAGSVVVTGSTFYNNSASTGGAISANTSATVSDSTFANNTAVEGGAIDGGGTVSNSIFSGNQAGYGAAIDASGFTLNANFNLYDSNVDNQSGNTLADICNSCTSNTNPVSGNANLAPLGSYGGPTTTMLPLPGSAAICAGSAALVPVGDMFDQRGFPISTTYGSTVCSDLGAVQTSYGLSFTTEPPATGTAPGTAMSPVAVTVKESGNLLSGGSASVNLTDANTDLTTTPATGATTAGVATFSSLVFTSSTTGDTLTATLPLNSALTTPLSITTPSTSFSVSPSTVNVSIGTSPAGLSFSINGAASTSTQTPTLTIGTAYTLATTSPQYAQGTQFTFVSWSDGTTTTTDTLTPTATTTSDTASFSATGYQLTVAAGAGGTITGTAANGYYTAASQQSLVATPNGGYYFTGWTGSSDVASASSASTSVTMNAPETITAGFASIPSYTVTNLSDSSNSGSLRAAITAADANNGGAGTITFAPSLTGTITLLSALPPLTGSITISGPGASVVTVSGNSDANVGAIFVVNSGATVGISGLTIANGSGAGYGGGIDNKGTLTVSHCALTGNKAGSSGPGGIYNDNDAKLTVIGSTFSGNTGYLGGGIGSIGIVLVSNSTFNQNVALRGGGISNLGTLTANDSTFSGNQSEDGGGGIDNTDPNVKLNNNILSGNTSGNSLAADCAGCGVQSSGNLLGGAPLLAPLGNYGGPTQTMLPLPGSPAICAGSAALIPAGTTTDQRGFPISTTYGSTVCTDLGAVQTSYALGFSTEPPATGTLPGTAMSAVAVTVKESGNLLTGGSATVNVSDANADLTTTPATGATSAGVATFSSLIFKAATTGDTLSATLPLNLNIPLSISTQSTAFGVASVTPAFSFVPSPKTQTYGTPIAGGSLDATATASNVTVPGTFAYTTTIGGVANQPVTAGVTILPVGPYTITAAFTPANPSANTAGSTTAAYSVTQATPALTVPTASAITYGQTLASSKLTGGSALSGTTIVAGTFTFTTPTTVPTPGTQTESVTFTPSNTTNYATVTGNVSITVNKATPILTLPTASAIVYGQSLASSKLTGGSALSGSTIVAGTFTFTTPATVPAAAGTPLESVTFTPANTADYATVTANVTVTVAKATPAITWTTPAPITYGTALSGTQLDAKSGSVAGSFSYTPASGILAAGMDKLSVTFTPANAANYTTGSAAVMLTVNQASTTITVASSMNPSGYGQPVTFTAILHSSATGETGTVSWVPAICAPTPVSAGIAQCTVSTLTLGTHTISASYGGDKNFIGSQGGLPGSQLVEQNTLKFSAPTVNFSNVFLNSTVTQNLTVTNTGLAAVAISSVTIPVAKGSGNDPQEFVARNLCPSSLAAGKSCTITVSFSASVKDYSPSASLILTNTAAGSPQTIPLSATVINPILAEEPNSLSFAKQKVGTTSAIQKVAMVNQGTTPLVFSSLSITANFAFAAGTTCTSTTTLAPGKSCTLNVVFQPSSTGAKAGRIFTTNNSSTPLQYIYLTGTGD